MSATEAAKIRDTVNRFAANLPRVKEAATHRGDTDLLYFEDVAILIAAASAWATALETGRSEALDLSSLETAMIAFDRIRLGGPSMEGRSHFHGSMSSDEYAAFMSLFDLAVKL